MPGRAHLRSAPRALGGAPAAPLAVLLALLAGCTGAVDVGSTGPPATQDAACAAFVADLPTTLDGLEAREVTPSDAAARAWGDPAVVLTCGAARPDGLDRFASCEEIDGVGWFVSPQSAYDDLSADVALTTIGVRPRLRLDVPGEQRPPADFLALLAPLVREHLRVVQPCV